MDPTSIDATTRLSHPRATLASLARAIDLPSLSASPSSRTIEECDKLDIASIPGLLPPFSASMESPVPSHHT
jgi:hypothetical protein